MIMFHKSFCKTLPLQLWHYEGGGDENELLISDFSPLAGHLGCGGVLFGDEFLFCKFCGNKDLFQTLFRCFGLFLGLCSLFLRAWL